MPNGAHRWWLIGGGVAMLIVAGLVWFAAAGGFGGGPAVPGPVPGGSSAAPTASATSPVPEPSIASPTATGSPTVEPTRTPTSVRTDLDGKVETTSGVTASVEKVEAVTGEARGPGEIAGPALRVTISVKNDSKAPIRTELGLINVYYGKDRKPAGTLSGPGVTAFPEQIPAGGSGIGTSVFTVPTSQRGRVEVEFSYSTTAPVVIFSGAA